MIAGGIIVLAALAAYHNSFSAPFLFDDKQSIAENPTIRHLWSLGTVLSPPGTEMVGGRPVVNFSLALNYAFGGTAVWGYHAVNLAVHILAGLTLFGLVRRTLLQPVLRARFGASALPLALVVAVLWTVHPLQTEAVTYISQRAESLMGLFYLLTVYWFIRGTESPGSGLWFALSVVACLLGVGSKEVIVSAPLMVLLYDRTFVAGTFREAWTQRWRVHAALASTCLLLGCSMVGWRNRGVGYGLGVTWWGYALTECRAITHYLWLAIWPRPLVFDYGRDIIIGDAVKAAPYALILVLLVAGVVAALKRWPVIGFAGAWFFVILAPASSVIPVSGQPMAEHRVYLSLAAVVALATVGSFALEREFLSLRPPTRKMLEWGVAGTLVWLLAILTIQRNGDYRSELVIWEDTVVKCPDNSRAHNALGLALAEVGRVPEALGHYEQALRLKPDYAEAYNNLATLLFELGRVPEAVGFYEQALRLNPGYARAHYNLGNTLGRSGRTEDAVRHYHEALRLKPEYAEAHNNLAIVLTALGRAPEAVVHLDEAVRLKPDYVEAQSNLARLLATLAPAAGGDPVRAVSLAQRACELTGNRVAAAVDTLAIAYAAGGRFEEAIATAQKAIDLARSDGQPQLAGEIAVRLQMYRGGHPYRESSNPNRMDHQ